jgi:hypothetical protein
MAARLTPRRALVALVACGGLACGLEVSGTGHEDTTGGEHPTSSSGGSPLKAADSGATGGGGEDVDASPGSSADANPATDLPPDDAGAPDVHVLDPDASYEEAGDPCDLDEDGYRATGSCGGADCCDFDSRAHPGDTSYYPNEDACGSFDYDCDGKEEQEYGQGGCQLGFFSCSGAGFDKTVPTCGVSATFDTCPYDVLFCGGDQTSLTQACR